MLEVPLPPAPPSQISVQPGDIVPPAATGSIHLSRNIIWIVCWTNFISNHVLKINFLKIYLHAEQSVSVGRGQDISQRDTKEASWASELGHLSRFLSREVAGPPWDPQTYVQGSAQPPCGGNSFRVLVITTSFLGSLTLEIMTVGESHNINWMVNGVSLSQETAF